MTLVIGITSGDKQTEPVLTMEMFFKGLSEKMRKFLRSTTQLGLFLQTVLKAKL